MKKIACLFFLCIACINVSVAQQIDTVYTKEYLDKSTRFAWTTFGGDILVLGGGSSSFLNNGILQKSNFSNTVIPRLTIGGIHFWGHADFFVSFPLSFMSIQSKPNEFRELEYQHGIETGLKIYPIAIKTGRIRPYVGASFRLFSFSQLIEGTNFKYGSSEWQKMIFPISTGISYASKKYIFNFGLNYQRINKISNYISPNTLAEVNLHPISFQIGLTRYIDTDRNMRSEQSVAQENLKYHVLSKSKHLSSWYWGIGPSAGLQMSKSSFLKAKYPHLNDNFIGGFIPDITFGRFFNKPDLNIGLSYRTFGSTLKGFDDKITTRRHSLMIEAYKNLFNWLGFVPFAGITGSIEKLSVDINHQSYKDLKPAFGFIVGWDIRVTKTGTGLLRTNLRWVPGLNLEIDNKKMMFDNLEFNFIQWVQYIGRKKTYKTYKSN
jgi:hypothetical protein